MKISHEVALSARKLLVDIKQTKTSPETSSNKGDLSAISTKGMSEPLLKAVKLFSDQGYTLTQDAISAIHEFLESSPGSFEDKLMALEVLIQKEMPINPQLMHDIHSSRTGTLLDHLPIHTIPNIEGSMGITDFESSEGVTTIEDALLKVTGTLEALLSTLFEELSTKDGDKPVGIGDKIDFSREIEALDENEQKVLNEIIPQLLQSLGLQFHQSDVALESFSSKDTRIVLEQRITPRLLEIKAAFDATKKDVLAQLNTLSAREKPMTTNERVQVLAKVIDKLDALIMKSEAGLFLSLKGERDLLKQSSVVQKAREALISHDIKTSQSLVKSAMMTIEALSFKPTLSKVMALPQFSAVDPFPGALAEGADRAYEKLTFDFAKGTKSFSEQEPTVASLVHFLRRLGINHETEVFQRVFSKTTPSTASSSQAPANLKEQLLTLSRLNLKEDYQQSTEKAISHLSGQQLGNKLLDKPQVQQMMLAIPYQVNGQVAEVKVYIQAKQDQLKVDWQNFDMFFVLSTAQMGEVGIKVRAIHSKLSVDVLNNHIEREAIFTPLVEMLSKEIEDVGYEVTRMAIRTWGDEAKSQKPVLTQTSASLNTSVKKSEGGFDFKI